MEDCDSTRSWETDQLFVEQDLPFGPSTQLADKRATQLHVHCGPNIKYTVASLLQDRDLTLTIGTDTVADADAVRVLGVPELHDLWPDLRVGSGQDGLGTQIWRHEIKFVIKCCLACSLCHIWLLYIIPVFSMYIIYASDVTVDETLSASASAWNCRHNGTIVLIARCTGCKCRPPLCCFTASFGDTGPPALTTVPGLY